MNYKFEKIWKEAVIMTYSKYFPGIFLKGNSRDMKLTTHLHLVPRSEKRGSIHPLAYTPSWHRA
jgi:hypothetical protein